MNFFLRIGMLCLIFALATCESNFDSGNNDINRSYEVMIGLFALERFDELDKRYVESAPVTQVTWDTYDEGDEFDYKGYTWTILMKVSH